MQWRHTAYSRSSWWAWWTLEVASTYWIVALHQYSGQLYLYSSILSILSFSIWTRKHFTIKGWQLRKSNRWGMILRVVHSDQLVTGQASILMADIAKISVLSSTAHSHLVFNHANMALGMICQPANSLGDPLLDNYWMDCHEVIVTVLKGWILMTVMSPTTPVAAR